MPPQDLREWSRQMLSPIVAFRLRAASALATWFLPERLRSHSMPISSATWFESDGDWWKRNVGPDSSQTFDSPAEWTLAGDWSTDEPEAARFEFEYRSFLQPAACPLQENFELEPELSRDWLREPGEAQWMSVSEELQESLLSLDSYASLRAIATAMNGFRPRGKWRCFAASLSIHLILVSLLMVGYGFMTEGMGRNAGSAITVRLVDKEDATPEEEQPASLDSPASSAAVADRARRPDRLLGKNSPDKVLNLLEKDEQTMREDPPGREYDTKITKTREEMEKPPSKDSDIAIKSAEEADSVPSTPSLASPERSSMKAEGKDGDRFKGQVLSAIHQAAFFPRKALRGEVHQEVIVSFTINKDGSVSNLALAKHSGSDLLDEAAIKILQKASKQFPPIPDAMMTSSLRYEVPIIFRRKGPQDGL